MKSDEERELLLDFIDGTLAREAREELLDRMQEDSSLRRELESMQALGKSLEKLPLEQPRADFAERFMATHARPSLFERVQGFFASLPQPVAPTLALAGALGCSLFFFGADSGPVGPSLPLAGCPLVASAGAAHVNGDAVGGVLEGLRLEDRIEVSDDFEGALVYEDGTRIKIHPDSHVILRSRGLYLKQGAVWLNVTKDLKGFKVETPVALAAVKGTRFLVSLAEGAKKMTVLVTEGFVEVVSSLESKLLGALKGAWVGEDQRVETFSSDGGRHQLFEDAERGDFVAVPE